MAEFLNPHDPIVENFGAASSAMLMHLANIENGLGELDERLDLLAVEIPAATPERAGGSYQPSKHSNDQA